MEPCAPRPPAADRTWTEDKERLLIAFFSEHSCLWNHKSESYKNRQLRWQTLDHLRTVLSAHPPPAPLTVEDIKSKFKNLRTTFQRQHKMVQASRACSSEELVPQWKHYQQLLFLQGCWEQDHGADHPPPSPPSPLAVPEELGQPRVIVSLLPGSGAASNAAVKCCWTEEQERTLIAFYSEHSCLWNKKAENHNNRQLRLRLLDGLSSRLACHTLAVSVEDIKCKFKNLRTVFKREHKAVRSSRASDKPYVSKWKHYQQLLFLSEACEEDEGPDEHQTAASSASRRTEVRLDSGPAYQIFLSAADTRPPSPSTNGAAPGWAESRLLWSEAKVQQLIAFFSEHSCLWNHRSESYRNRQLKQSLLERLSRVLSDNQPLPFTVEDIKTKFRNLRTIFQREHKAVSSNRTCGSEDFYLPKWKHYRELMFLCDSCDEDEPPEDLVLLELQKSSVTTQLHQSALESHQSSPSPSPSPSSSLSPSPSTSSFNTDSPASGRKRASQRATPTGSEVLDFLRTFCQNQTVSPHAGFLKYVEECLNQTPANKVRKLKRRIIESIHSVTDELIQDPV